MSYHLFGITMTKECRDLLARHGPLISLSFKSDSSQKRKNMNCLLSVCEKRIDTSNYSYLENFRKSVNRQLNVFHMCFECESDDPRQH